MEENYFDIYNTKVDENDYYKVRKERMDLYGVDLDDSNYFVDKNIFFTEERSRTYEEIIKKAIFNISIETTFILMNAEEVRELCINAVKQGLKIINEYNLNGLLKDIISSIWYYDRKDALKKIEKKVVKNDKKQEIINFIYENIFDINSILMQIIPCIFVDVFSKFERRFSPTMETVGQNICSYENYKKILDICLKMTENIFINIYDKAEMDETIIEILLQKFLDRIPRELSLIYREIQEITGEKICQNAQDYFNNINVAKNEDKIKYLDIKNYEILKNIIPTEFYKFYSNKFSQDVMRNMIKNIKGNCDNEEFIVKIDNDGIDIKINDLHKKIFIYICYLARVTNNLTVEFSYKDFIVIAWGEGAQARKDTKDKLEKAIIEISKIYIIEKDKRKNLIKVEFTKENESLVIDKDKKSVIKLGDWADRSKLREDYCVINKNEFSYLNSTSKESIGAAFTLSLEMSCYIKKNNIKSAGSFSREEILFDILAYNKVSIKSEGFKDKISKIREELQKNGWNTDLDKEIENKDDKNESKPKDIRISFKNEKLIVFLNSEK